MDGTVKRYICCRGEQKLRLGVPDGLSSIASPGREGGKENIQDVTLQYRVLLRVAGKDVVPW